jgi:hypothetical protein
MIRIPLRWVVWAARHRIIHRPDFLCVGVSEAPIDEEMAPGMVYNEVRGGHAKWAHLLCPRCKDHIQIQTARGKSNWVLRDDWLNRPTIHPSVWETNACGAHFFVRQGRVVWCGD